MANCIKRSDNVEVLCLPKGSVVSILLYYYESSLRQLARKQKSLPGIRRELVALLGKFITANELNDDALTIITSIPAAKFKTRKAATYSINERVNLLQQMRKEARLNKKGTMYVI